MSGLFLWGLAWHNIRRNWARTILVIVGMATAAFILTASSALPSGHLPWAHGMHRAFMGGDLVVYSADVMARANAGSEYGATWFWQSWDQPWINDLAYFHPSLVEEGFIAPGSDLLPYFDPDHLPAPLLEHPDVVSVEPYLVMPGVLRVAMGALYDAPLRALDIERGSAGGFTDLIVAGRYFTPEDQGTMVALVNSARPAYWPRPGERHYPVPPLWEFIEISVPALSGYRDGYPVYDYQDMHVVRLRVVGHFTLPLGDSWVADEFGNPLADPITGILYFPHYWHTPQVVIPASTWLTIFRETAGGHPLRTYQLGVEVTDTMEARAVARQLGEILVGRTVHTVGDQALMAENRVRISSTVPPDTVPEVEAALLRGAQPADAPDLSRLVAYLSFLLAGCLVMANMQVLVAQRRRELGVLRAVGMSGAEVVLMILYEITVLGLIGAFIGFATVQLLVGSAIALSGVGLTYAIYSFLLSAAQVVGATVVVALVFGLWPAIRAARSTTMEVLTGE